MATADTQTNVRIPRELKERLEAAAAADGRSLSSEFTVRLTFAYEAESMLKKAHAEIDSLLAQSKDLRAMLEEARAAAIGARTSQARAEARVAELEGQVQSLTERRDAEIADAVAAVELQARSLLERVEYAEKVTRNLRAVCDVKDDIAATLARFMVIMEDLTVPRVGSEKTVKVIAGFARDFVKEKDEPGQAMRLLEGFVSTLSGSDSSKDKSASAHGPAESEREDAATPRLRPRTGAAKTSPGRREE